MGVKSYPDTLIFSAYDKDATSDTLLGISKKTPWYSWTHDNWVDAGKLYAYVGNTSYMFRGKDYRLSRYLGLKHYELTDHLGNVNVAVLDKISGTGTGNAGEYAYLSANISSFNDYYPFGMPMPERNGSLEQYRFGFNGQEKDNEIKGDGNQVDFKFRAYDTRLGRFMAVDPLGASYPYYTPYQFAGNTPIQAIDLEGAEPIAAGKLNSVQVENGGSKVKIQAEATIRIQVLNLSKEPSSRINQSLIRSHINEFGTVLNGTHTADISGNAYRLNGGKLVYNSVTPNDKVEATYDLKVKFNVEFITSINEIKNDAIVLGIVNDVSRPGHPDPDAVGSQEYVTALIPVRFFLPENIMNKARKYIHHELGHIFGLDHSATGAMKTRDHSNQLGFTPFEKVQMKRSLLGNWYDAYKQLQKNKNQPADLKFEVDMKNNFKKIYNEFGK